MKAAFLLHSPASAHSRHLGDSLELTELQLSEQAWHNATRSTSVEVTVLRNPLKSSQIQVAIGFPLFSNYTVSICIQENHLGKHSSWHMAQPPGHGLEHVGRISSALTSSGPNPTIFTLICSREAAKRPSGQQPESPHGKDQWMSLGLLILPLTVDASKRTVNICKSFPHIPTANTAIDNLDVDASFLAAGLRRPE